MAKRIIIHAGLPKTGSTIIQHYLYRCARQLDRRGIFYPEPDSPLAPKHRFLVQGLLKGQFGQLSDLLAAAPGNKAILLSEEGLTNHLFDFSKEACAAFRRYLSNYQSEAIIVTRSWRDWIRSYYKQCIVNPPHKRWTQYAFPGTLEAFQQHPRVKVFMEMEGIGNSVRTFLGFDRVVEIPYSDNVVTEFFSHILGTKHPELPIANLENANRSISDVAAEAVRQVNSIVKDPKLRNQWAGLIASLDGCDNTVACSYLAGESICCEGLHPAIPMQLEWTGNSGLNVDQHSFERFCNQIGRTLSESAR